jgi:signal transduction histidine kinase/ActR/RegA family two-component response regulator
MDLIGNRYLHAVGRISEGLYARTTVQDVIRYTLSMAVELVHAEAGAVLLAHAADAQELVFSDAIGAKATAVIGTAIPSNQGLAGAVFLSGQSEIVTNVETDSRHLSIVDSTTGFTTRQMIVAPLKRWNGAPMGVLEILNKKVDVFTQEDADILSILGALASAVIEQMRTTEALRQTEAQLREAHKMEAVGRLAGGIAHDFNNLVTVIMGYSEMLLSGPFNEEDCRRDLGHIREAGRRAAGLTRQLLTFSRRQVFHPTILDVNEAILSTTEMLQKLLGEDIQVVTNLDTSIQNIEIDRNQLEQVIMNLAVNARDAMEHGGRLVFHTTTVHISKAGELPVNPGRYVAIAVSDTGCGMEPMVVSHIFEPFFTTKPIDKGTGLGLATVYGIVQHSGGGITVQSEVGRGTTFTIYLPVSVKGVASVNSSPSSITRVTDHGTVLLVEDEPAVRTLVATVLKARGYDVVQALHGLEALQKIQTMVDPPDLILTDVVMPQMSGFELIQQVRQQHPDVRVLYMSGYSDHPALKQDVLSGTAFLQKPFTADGLTQAVRQAIHDDKSPMSDRTVSLAGHSA